MSMAEDKTGNMLNNSECPGSNTAWLVLLSKVRSTKWLGCMLKSKAPMGLFHKDAMSVLYKSSPRFCVIQMKQEGGRGTHPEGRDKPDPGIPEKTLLKGQAPLMSACWFWKPQKQEEEEKKNSQNCSHRTGGGVGVGKGGVWGKGRTEIIT